MQTNKFNIFAAMILGMFYATILHSHANSILVEGDFDSLSVSTAPDVGSVGYWGFPDDYVRNDVAETNITEFSIAAAPGGTNGNCLHLLAGVNVLGNQHLPNIFTQTVNKGGGQFLITTFDVYVQPGHGGGAVYLGNGYSSTNRGPQILWDISGNLYYADSAGNAVFLSSYVRGNWQSFRLEVDIDHDRYNLYAGPRGLPFSIVASNLVYRSGVIPYFDRFEIARFSVFPDADAYFDNVVVVLPPPAIPLSVQHITNGYNLVVGSIKPMGAVFLQMAGDLPTLFTNPIPLYQIDSPLTSSLVIPITQFSGVSTQAFFNAAFYPNASVADFGDPEDYIPPPDETNILISSGLPTNLISNQTFPIAFIVTDPAGKPVPITGTATILLTSTSDGTPHPDATINPPTGQMTNGFFQTEITISALSSLDGYTLALSINTTPPGSLNHNSQTSILLQDFFDLGPLPSVPQAIGYFIQQFAQLFANNTDNSGIWASPLVGGGYGRVSGTFGEWRGHHDANCHHGLDLPAPLASTVVASRSGVVSKVGSAAGIGWYVIVDHGNGWFSRYLHLDGQHIRVKKFQSVVGGQTILADQLYNFPTGSGLTQHLHFEVRYDSAKQQHNDGAFPGRAQDPVQTDHIFDIPKANASPQIFKLGLTHFNPGETVFEPDSTDVAAGLSEYVYVFANIVDKENGNNLGPRSLSFLPEGATTPQVIAPANDVAINSYLPNVNGAREGFAKYHLNADHEALSKDYFRYWFRWDTPMLSNTGPRKFQMTVTGYSGLMTDYNFIFGPKILDIGRLDRNTYRVTTVAYLGAKGFVQPDQYQMTVMGTNGEPLNDINWDNQIMNGLTSVIKTHMQMNDYSFTLPPGHPDEFILQVKSRIAPGIMDAFTNYLSGF